MVLQYVISSRNGFHNAPPIAFENEIGRFELADDILTVLLKDNADSVDNAKESVNSCLSAWAFQEKILTLSEITFDSYDENRLVTSEVYIENMRTGKFSLGFDADGELVFKDAEYPAPLEIKLTPEMSQIWDRFKYAELREPIQSSAYFSLTVIQRAAGGLREASEQYNIHLNVLKELGRLTTTKGGADTARKALPSYEDPLSSTEKHWIGFTIRAIILQMGQLAAGLQPDQLTLDNLPQLHTL